MRAKFIVYYPTGFQQFDDLPQAVQWAGSACRLAGWCDIRINKCFPEEYVMTVTGERPAYPLPDHRKEHAENGAV